MKENDWIFPEDNYNEEFKNWKGPIHIVEFLSQTLKKKINTEETRTKYAGYDNSNSIPREESSSISIKSYKYQLC